MLCEDRPGSFGDNRGPKRLTYGGPWPPIALRWAGEVSNKKYPCISSSGSIHASETSHPNTITNVILHWLHLAPTQITQTLKPIVSPVWQTVYQSSAKCTCTALGPHSLGVVTRAEAALPRAMAIYITQTVWLLSQPRSSDCVLITTDSIHA